jgi:hypothetical protein
MNLTELKRILSVHPDLTVAVALPEGDLVPAHFHVTEVGHVAKKFVDCGGTFRASEACVLQTYVGSAHDDGHRLTAGRLGKILELASPILPGADLPVEIEYESGVVAQFPLVTARAAGGGLTLQLGLKHTACLAKDRCGISEAGDREGEAERCCAGASAGGGCC